MGLSKNDDNLYMYFNMSSILGFEKEWLNTRHSGWVFQFILTNL